MPVLCASAKPMEAPNKAELMGGGPENNMVTQALAIVEKKVRNLEKRKGELDGYQEDKRRGKELNEDQKAAVAKYDFQLENLATYLQPPQQVRRGGRHPGLCARVDGAVHQAGLRRCQG